MRTLTIVLLALAVAGNAAAQRRARIGPTVSSISLENGSGGSNSFTSFGGSLAFLSGDDGELGFGLGVRVNLGNQAAALVEGRFFQVPNSAIKALEGRADVSFAFGSPAKTKLLNGTLGPAVGVLAPLSGALEGRGPTFGVRFRRDQKKGGSVGLQVDYAPLTVKTGCTGNCRPYAILFAPGYEPSLHPAWGRFYAEVGLLLAGFPQIGDDRGVAQGAHA